ncbi:hypothetical protein MA16_Dca019283 [Dendrobium catenatum]|uniref:Uncharacterized protein n=1 Tax=Dendrobium catenatum TaxID=906689 RepID=A0A2I0X3W3_9ASPA|nr:hypothetical protein MA16_Dca019283 [Dendrobium catenatum]
MDGQGEGFDTLSHGLDSKLKKAANTFAFTDEIKDDDYKVPTKRSRIRLYVYCVGLSFAFNA